MKGRIRERSRSFTTGRTVRHGMAVNAAKLFQQQHFKCTENPRRVSLVPPAAAAGTGLRAVRGLRSMAGRCSGDRGRKYWMIPGRICCSGRFAKTQGNPNSYFLPEKLRFTPANSIIAETLVLLIIA